MFPSDLIVIETSNDGACFIQTSSLDGEKNLKKRLKPKDFKIEKVASGGEEMKEIVVGKIKKKKMSEEEEAAVDKYFKQG